MNQFEGEIQQYSMKKEAELQQKIQSLQGDMLQLFNKLLIEKQKLDQAMSKQYDPVVNDSNQSNPTNVEHLPQCPNTRMVLEIDPNCKLHGHVYSKNSEIATTSLNAHSILSMYNMNGTTGQDNNYAGGDINKAVDNSINLTSISPDSGDKKQNICHVTNCYDPQEIESIGINHINHTDNISNNYHQYGQFTQANAETYVDLSQNQMPYTEKLQNFLNNDINKPEKDASMVIPNEIPTRLNENSVLKQNVYNNLNTNSQLNICKILEISDYQNCLLNSENFDNCLKELNGSQIEQSELGILLKALNITEMNTNIEEKQDDTFEQLLQEIISNKTK